MNGLLDGDLHGLIQVFVESHEDPVRFRLRPWPFRPQILAHDRLDFDFLVRALEGRHVLVRPCASRMGGPALGSGSSGSTPTVNVPGKGLRSTTIPGLNSVVML